jgi:hypothetical protein
MDSSAVQDTRDQDEETSVCLMNVNSGSIASLK